MYNIYYTRLKAHFQKKTLKNFVANNIGYYSFAWLKIYKIIDMLSHWAYNYF